MVDGVQLMLVLVRSRHTYLYVFRVRVGVIVEDDNHTKIYLTNHHVSHATQPWLDMVL
jgi:hypothetical protein